MTWRTNEGFHRQDDFLTDLLRECRCEIALKTDLGSHGRTLSLPIPVELEGSTSSERLNAKVHAFAEALSSVLQDG